MDSLRERLEALQSYVETLDAAVTHNTSESLLEWHLRRLALDIELVKAEALIILAEGRKTDVSFSGTAYDAVTDSMLAEAGRVIGDHQN